MPLEPHDPQRGRHGGRDRHACGDRAAFSYRTPAGLIWGSAGRPTGPPVLLPQSPRSLVRRSWIGATIGDGPVPVNFLQITEKTGRQAPPIFAVGAPAAEA